MRHFRLSPGSPTCWSSTLRSSGRSSAWTWTPCWPNSPRTSENQLTRYTLLLSSLNSWDSFPLFQVLNDYLNTDGKQWLRGETKQLEANLFRQFEERQVPPTLARHLRAAGDSLRGPDGVLPRPVHPQGVREGKVGNQRVRKMMQNTQFF